MIADVSDVRHGPDQTEVVRQRRHSLVQRRNSHAGNRRRDRLIGAPDFGRSVRFQVPGIEMAWATAQQNEDAGFFGRSATKALNGIHARGHCSRHPHRQGAQSAGLQEFSARDLVGGESSIVLEPTHCRIPQESFRNVSITGVQPALWRWTIQLSILMCCPFIVCRGGKSCQTLLV